MLFLYDSVKDHERSESASTQLIQRLRARLHTGKFSSDKKISFVLNPLVVHESSQDKEKLPVQGNFLCVNGALNERV